MAKGGGNRLRSRKSGEESCAAPGKTQEGRGAFREAAAGRRSIRSALAGARKLSRKVVFIFLIRLCRRLQGYS
jgi:hypothetical protein